MHRAEKRFTRNNPALTKKCFSFSDRNKKTASLSASGKSHKLDTWEE